MESSGQATSLGPQLDSRPSYSIMRYLVVVLLMAYAGFVHFNRISISVAGTEILIKDKLISETDMGLVYSAYLFVYTLCMIPGGWLIDRFGPRNMLLIVGFGSAILVPLTGFAILIPPVGMFLVLCLVRSCLGVVSTPIHPAAARAVSFWMPPRSRGLANGLVTGAAVTGIALTYYVFGNLLDRVGFTWAFVISGIVTLGLALVWKVLVTDRPADHSLVSQNELDLITAQEQAQPLDPRVEKLGPPHDGSLYGSRSTVSLILLTISYATVSYFQYMFFYWVQYYFDTVLKLGTDKSRLYSTIILFSMAGGMIVGGWCMDFILAQVRIARGRAIVPLCGMLASALFLILGAFAPNQYVVLTCFSLAMLTLGASEAAFWMTGVELGKHRGGMSGAFLNAGGNAGGIPAPYLTPLISGYVGWKGGLVLAAALCVVGAVLWLFIETDEDAARRFPSGGELSQDEMPTAGAPG